MSVHDHITTTTALRYAAAAMLLRRYLIRYAMLQRAAEALLLDAPLRRYSSASHYFDTPR